jgi:hypothetical protein
MQRIAVMRFMLMFTLLVSSANVMADSFEVGLGIDIAADLGDAGLDQGNAQMGLGPTIRSPMRWSPHPKVAVRSDLFFSMLGGQDRVEWSQYNGAVSYHSEDHWTLMTQLGAEIGPEISPWEDENISPYAGAHVGMAWVRHWHSFDGGSAVLLDPKENDLNSGSNIDPFSDQWSPMAGIQAGVRFADVLPFAFEAELGYNVAFLRAAPLKKARPTLNAVRTAYGFNPIRIGVNAVFPL